MLEPWVRELRRSAALVPAVLSKFDAGVLARGAELPAPINLGPTAVDENSVIGALADAVLRRHLLTLLDTEGGTRLGEDPEALHDMRVAARRLRAALSSFKGLFPPQLIGLLPELGWLGQVLGSVRDLDIGIARLQDAKGSWRSELGASASAIDELSSLLNARREGARSSLLRALESPRYERLTTLLIAVAQQGAAEHSVSSRIPALQFAPSTLDLRIRRVMKAARRARSSGEQTDLHRLRISCKKLRYSLEFFNGLLGPPAAHLQGQLTVLQDLLGELHDNQVSVIRYRELATGRDPALSPPAAFVAGVLAEQSVRRSKKLARRSRSATGVLLREDLQSVLRSLEHSELTNVNDRATTPPPAKRLISGGGEAGRSGLAGTD
ncbi:MAG: CHAD domain-containing protein [Acidimicrobiales bacterium]